MITSPCSHPLKRVGVLLLGVLALVAALFLGSPPATTATAQADQSTITPLPPELEAIRAERAIERYGSPEIRPPAERDTAVVSMGDSEISGEGQGPYETGTNGDDDGDGDENWCHRAKHAAIHRTGIPVDATRNLACSGAATKHLIEGSGAQQWDELNQGDHLAITARNLNVELVWVVASANDSGGIEFGPVVTDCTIRRILFLGNCWPKYTDTVQARVTVSGENLATAVTSVKQTMTDAGYAASDYQLVVMSYPSPASPDVEDNPDFPGWYGGGCLLYLKDMALGRNKVVPMFERAIRAAAEQTGVRYLDASRLFHGHEPCTQRTWVTGVKSSGGDPADGNTYRQSWHPNARGHGAFGSCMGAFYARPDLPTATCVDPGSTNDVALYDGTMSFPQLRNVASGLCVDSEGYSTRNTYDLLQWTCHGGRNQGWWLDPTRDTLHIELTHDRCADVESGLRAGHELVIYNCHGGPNQRFTLDDGLIRSTAKPGLCAAVPGTAKGARLRMVSCDPSDPRQQWRAEPKTGDTGYGYRDWIPSSAY